MSKWREQYDRMKRSHARLKEPSVPADRRVDDFYTFFVWCFHLKDWLKNDPSVDPGVAKAGESLVNNSDPLKLCADLANGVKHLSARRTPRVDPDLRIEYLSAMINDPSQPDAIQIVDAISIIADGPQWLWDAPEVADACVQAWESFLQQHRLL